MKLLLSILVVFLALTGLISEEIGLNEDLDQWKNSLQIQDEWLSSDPLNEILRRITRKPRPRQFFGLMGKRSYPNAQITRKRQKLNPFVSLMGKRSQEEPGMPGNQGFSVEHLPGYHTPSTCLSSSYSAYWSSHFPRYL